MLKRENVYVTKNFEETQKVAERFSKRLKGGSLVALYGDLGSGKTTFVQGLAKGLGIKRRIISPTFIVLRTYKISSKYQVSSIKQFCHIDLYRIENEKDIEGLGIQEILGDPQNIVAIEWAEKMGGLLPKKRIDVGFEYVDENKRRITILQLS